MLKRVSFSLFDIFIRSRNEKWPKIVYNTRIYLLLMINRISNKRDNNALLSIFTWLWCIWCWCSFDIFQIFRWMQSVKRTFFDSLIFFDFTHLCFIFEYYVKYLIINSKKVEENNFCVVVCYRLVHGFYENLSSDSYYSTRFYCCDQSIFKNLIIPCCYYWNSFYESFL